VRLVLLTGGGGAGRTTVAAATAAHAARCGVKTLALAASGGPAGELAALLGGTCGPDGEVSPGLHTRHVPSRWDVPPAPDGGRRGDAGGLPVGPPADVAAALGVDLPAPELLDLVPGTPELASATALAAALEHGPWDLVVVDGPPAEAALRLLTLPTVLDAVLAKALPAERRVTRLLSGPAGAGADALVEVVERAHASLAGLRAALAPDSVCVRLVAAPTREGIEHARRTATALHLHGYVVDALVVDALVPAPDGDAARDGWHAALAAEQQAQLAVARTAFATLPVLPLLHTGAPPRGSRALTLLGEQLYGPAGPGAADALVAAAPARDREAVRVHPEGAGFVLRIALPTARSGEVRLARRGDDLVVTVPAGRRVLPLPAGLRRCTVTGARLRDGELAVGFEPDPARWRTA